MSSETPSQDAPPAQPPVAAESPAGGDKEDEISFVVKSIADTRIPITVNPFISIAELKQKLAEPSSIPADRQRLIYSGRVLKDDQTVQSYKIQSGHTVHLVKGAASTASAARGTVGGTSSSTSGTAAGSSNAAQNPTPQLPNMAAGTGMNPLSRLTNHIPLPSADFFGPDGGMGPPPDPEQLYNMMDSPEVRSSMNAVLSNPALLDSLIQSNPMLQAMGPEARRMMQSQEFRNMMTDPTVFRQMTQMQRMMGLGPFGRGGPLGGGAGGAGAFPAPGVTDQTPSEQQQGGQQNPGVPGVPGIGQTLPGMPPMNPFAALFNPMANSTTPQQTPPPPSAGGFGGQAPNPFMFLNPALFQQQQQGQTQTQTPGSGDQAATGGTGAATGGQSPPPPNPFGANQPFGGLDLGQLDNMMRLLGMPGAGAGAGGLGGLGGMYGAGGSPPPPQDTRPPEEIYADQLRQLNDMGFTDFDRNITALRRSGGSVQGAVEYLLSN